MRTGPGVARRARRRGQEVLPGPAADSTVWGQVRAGLERAGGLAGEPDRYDRPTLFWAHR